MVFYRVLELALGHQPVRYRDLVVHPKSEPGRQLLPGARGHPPTLNRQCAGRP